MATLLLEPQHQNALTRAATALSCLVLATGDPLHYRMGDAGPSVAKLALQFAGPLAQGVLEPGNFVTVVSNFVTSSLVALATS